MAEKPLTKEQMERGEALIIAKMREGKFTFASLWNHADRELGIGGEREPSTYRLADRLIQRERKAGRIRLLAGRAGWEPVA